MGYPSLFMDGEDLWPISIWRNRINSRIADASPVTLVITGDYNSSTNEGTVNAAYTNDSSAAITARVYFVITEDSLYHVDPNGHAWHNHLARDMLPDHIGEVVTIDPGQTVNVSRDFTLDTSWIEEHCHIVTWIQVDPPSREGLQAGEEDILDLVGIDEYVEEPAANLNRVWVRTNPCPAHNIRLAVSLPEHTSYRIQVFDILGRRVKIISGTVTGNTDEIAFSLEDRDLPRSGVYLYTFQSDILNTTGKFVVQ
jgi:hypothetical protein